MGNKYKVLNSWFSKSDKFGQKFSSYCKKIDDTEILCVICNKKISCGRKGFAALKQHVSTALHESAAKKKSTQLLLKPHEAVNVPEKATDSPTKTIQLCYSKEADMKAELIWALKVVQCNMAASTTDDLKFVFSSMFPTMTENFSLGRTKLSYLITEALGPYFRKELLNDVGQSFFTLIFNETTNHADKKELQFKIRYWSAEENQVVCKHLHTVFIGHATAEDIIREIRTVLNRSNLSAQKLIMLSTDGPNVNKKVWNLLNNSLIEERGSGLLDIGTCNLHVVNNAFLKGLDEYGDVACELAIDIFYYFKKFPSRWEDYQKIQIKKGVPKSRFLKHVSSRWLTAGPACERLLEQWPAVQEYFLIFIPQKKAKHTLTTKYKQIIKYIKIVDIKIELLFVIESANIFGAFQAFFLQSEPLIHLLYSEFTGILQKLKGRICKPDTNVGDLISVENLLRASDIDCGDKISFAIKSLKEKERLGVLYKIQRHYMESHNYLATQFKRSNILKLCTCLQPSQILEETSLKHVGQLAVALQFLEVDSASVKDEWRVLQSEISSPATNDYHVRVDHFWREALNKKTPVGQLKYPLLNNLVKASLSLSHGNGDVERGFSVSKKILAEDKSKMSERMLNERLIIKDSLTKHKHVGEVKITKELLKLAYGAHKSYDSYLEEQRKLKEQTLKENREREERIEKEKQREDEIKSKASSIKQLEEKAKIVAQEKKKNQESADSLLKEANKRLKSAINKNDLCGVRVAQGMIEGAEKLRERERTTEQKETKLNHIVNKRKSNLIEKFISKQPKNV